MCDKLLPPRAVVRDVSRRRIARVFEGLKFPYVKVWFLMVSRVYEVVADAPPEWAH